MMVKHKPLPPQSLKTPPRPGATKVVVVSLIAVVGVALLAGVGYWFYSRMQAQGEEVNYAWLPPDAEFIVKVDVAAAWNSEVVQRVLKHPDGPGSDIKEGIKEMREALALEEGANPDVFESVTIGGMVPEKDGRSFTQKILMVVRKKTAWDKEGLLKKAKKFEESDLDGTTYYADKKMAMFFPDANTMVVGELELVKDSIVRGPKSDAPEKLEKKFAFLPKGHIVAGFLPKDPQILHPPAQEAMAENMLKGILDGKPYFQKLMQGNKDMIGGGVAVQLTDGLKLQGMVKLSSEESAASYNEANEALMTDAHKFLDDQRDMINNLDPKLQEIVGVVETIFDSVSYEQNGDIVSSSMEISKDVIDRSEKIAKDIQANGLPDLSKFMPPGLGGVMPRPDGGLRSIDKNNLKQIGLALHNYHDTFNNFPVAKNAQGEKSQLSWRVHILPYMDMADLYEEFHLDEPWDSEHNKSLIADMPPFFERPGSHADVGKTTYLGIDGPGGAMENGGGKRVRDFTDGLTNTIMVVGVKDSAAVTWTKPEDYKYDENDPKRDLGGWPGGFHALLGDGSVRFIQETVSEETIIKLFKMNDGQVIEDF